MESREPFSRERLEELHDYLVIQNQVDQCVDYEIRIDHLVAVRRTNDTVRFYDFEQQLKDTSCELRVLIFKGASRKSDKYCFVIREVSEPQSFQQQLEQAIRQEKEAMLIRMEMDYLQKKVKDQKRTIKDLKQALQNGSGSGGMANMLKELSASPLVRGMLAGNSTNVDLAALGALPNDEVLNVIQHYRAGLGEESFQELLGTMLAMAQTPNLIPKVRKFITSETGNHEKEREDNSTHT